MGYSSGANSVIKNFVGNWSRDNLSSDRQAEYDRLIAEAGGDATKINDVYRDVVYRDCLNKISGEANEKVSALSGNIYDGGSSVSSGFGSIGKLLESIDNNNGSIDSLKNDRDVLLNGKTEQIWTGTYYDTKITTGLHSSPSKDGKGYDALYDEFKDTNPALAATYKEHIDGLRSQLGDCNDKISTYENDNSKLYSNAISEFIDYNYQTSICRFGEVYNTNGSEEQINDASQHYMEAYVLKYITDKPKSINGEADAKEAEERKRLFEEYSQYVDIDKVKSEFVSNLNDNYGIDAGISNKFFENNDIYGKFVTADKAAAVEGHFIPTSAIEGQKKAAGIETETLKTEAVSVAYNSPAVDAVEEEKLGKTEASESSASKSVKDLGYIPGGGSSAAYAAAVKDEEKKSATAKAVSVQEATNKTIKDLGYIPGGGSSAAYEAMTNSGEKTAAQPTAKPTPSKPDPYAFEKPAREAGMTDEQYKEMCDKAEAENKRKVNEAAADAVIRGEYGCGTDRIKALQSGGYNYKDVQSIVNEKMDAYNKAAAEKAAKETAEKAAKEAAEKAAKENAGPAEGMSFSEYCEKLEAAESKSAEVSASVLAAYKKTLPESEEIPEEPLKRNPKSKDSNKIVEEDVEVIVDDEPEGDIVHDPDDSEKKTDDKSEKKENDGITADGASEEWAYGNTEYNLGDVNMKMPESTDAKNWLGKNGAGGFGDKKVLATGTLSTPVSGSTGAEKTHGGLGG